MPIEYRTCTTNEDYSAAQRLEMLIWNMDASEAVDSHTLQIINHTGGHVGGAFDGAMMIGFTVAFATHDPKRLWSHIAGVHPDYQAQGIGNELKQRQKAWAMAQGYERMSWTFDPLQVRNAHFNFAVLGAECNIYHENFYGQMNDGINAGMPSDRFEVTWHFNLLSQHPLPQTAPSILTMYSSQNPEIHPVPESAWLRIEIPYNTQELKASSPELALNWRLALRETCQKAFAAGYKVINFQQDRASQSAAYWLRNNK